MLNPARWTTSISPRLMRLFLRLHPATRNSGVKVDRISDDWREWDLRLPLRFKTSNVVGTHFGGTLYSAADPHFMLAWMHILGPGYVVWDKASTIQFRKPGRGTLRGRIRITQQEIDDVQGACADGSPHEPTFRFAWMDGDGDTVCDIEQVLHFRHGR